MILDGWGINPATRHNAVALAQTPFLDRLQSEFPSTQLGCAGEAVGLPDGIMGNSEVGHLNIGAGRIVYQDLLRIDRSIVDGSFFTNPVLRAAMDAVARNGKTLHLMGLVSNGGVHSQLSHLLVLLEMAQRRGVGRTCVHAILDGRDTPPTSGAGFVKQVQQHMAAHRYGAIATLCGRYFAMDRDQRWERVEKAYRLYTLGQGTEAFDPVSALQRAYEQNQTDEFVEPIVIVEAPGRPIGTVGALDAIIFFNFRADRAREITRAFTEPDFDKFERRPLPQLQSYACMTIYDETFRLPVAYGPVQLSNTLGAFLSAKGVRQLRIAETEKYAHVTYFFNGGEEKPFPLEERCLIPSPREVATYDLKPEMSALQVTEEVLRRLDSDRYEFVVLNFANLDMVGHTGVLSAAVKASETVDRCVGRVVKRLREKNWAAVLTADHGNAETMRDSEGGIYTAHTLNPVPLVLVDDTRKQAALRKGTLADIAPTILAVMGFCPPEEMTGGCLFETEDRPALR
jgi:2,3-bisphosphoglycerate-independent phosphoglycerate mutase